MQASQGLSSPRQSSPYITGLFVYGGSALRLAGLPAQRPALPPLLPFGSQPFCQAVPPTGQPQKDSTRRPACSSGEALWREFMGDFAGTWCQRHPWPWVWSGCPCRAAVEGLKQGQLPADTGRVSREEAAPALLVSAAPWASLACSPMIHTQVQTGTCSE